MYGQSTSYEWNPQVASEYEPLLQRLLIPLDCREGRAQILECQSPLSTLAGRAEIERSAWALPVALLDVANPSSAAGIGGLATRCGKGITAQWKGLQGGAVSLTNPWLLCDLGSISVAELQAGPHRDSGRPWCRQAHRQSHR